MSKERALLEKILNTGWLNHELSCEVEAILAKPEQDNIQYLLDQVARLTAENSMLKEKWSTSKQPEQNKAGAIIPNGVCVSNVYDAYEEGRKSVMSEQEPVAWMQDSIELYVLEEKSAIRGYVIPLYTAPPHREPLSDDEMRAIWKEGIRCEIPFVEIGRAIEKAHGIGGEE